MTGVPLLTTWYKGYREQNVFKRLYNSAMVRGARVIAVSDQIAELIAERYRVAPERIAVVPASIDMARFDPAAISAERLDAIRRAWGVKPDTKVILVVGRMLRRKGHHVAVKAVHRLKQRGLKDFVCVFAGEDQGRTRYTGELWDLVSNTGTNDVVRLAGAVDDMPAAYAAATVVVSASIQIEGLQRAILEAQAMARPVVVSDLAAGAEVVLAPPAVAEDRMTGLRVPAGDEAALAAALIRLFSLSDSARAGDRRARPRLGRGAFRWRQHRARDAGALCRRRAPQARRLTELQPIAAIARLRPPSALTCRRFVPIFRAPAHDLPQACRQASSITTPDRCNSKRSS